MILTLKILDKNNLLATNKPIFNLGIPPSYATMVLIEQWHGWIVLHMLTVDLKVSLKNKIVETKYLKSIVGIGLKRQCNEEVSFNFCPISS